MFNQNILVGDVPYMIERQIGYGMRSIVYGARDLHRGRSVAIKVINFSPQYLVSEIESFERRQLFQKELDMLLYLQPLNPYVIRVLDYDYNDQYGLIVMERGETFRDTLMRYLQMRRPMPTELIRQFWSQMVEAIAYLHRLDIVHADCKPENFIRLGADGTSLRLIDMGISFELGADETTQLRTMVGTPDYVAPEMINSRIGRGNQAVYGYKADIWALGIILFEMAFGFRPLQHLNGKETKLEFLAQLRDDIPIPYHPDKQLRKVLEQCLRCDPKARPSAEKLSKHRFLTGRWF